MLEIVGVDKTFNKGTVNEATLFENFSMNVKTGDFISIVGSNGSGKTTLLNIIGGSVSIDAGKIILDGQDITKLQEYKRARKIGRVFQDPSLGTVPGMTILENLSLAANKGQKYGLGFALDRKKTQEYKELLSTLGLGLENKTEVQVGLLSGGQRQALSLLMSTMTPIDLLLLDEHTAALDPKTAEIIMELTDEIVRKKKVTAIMVTHNLRYAVEYGKRIIMMHEGKTIIDKGGEEKKSIMVDDLLHTFNEISIECGN